MYFAVFTLCVEMPGGELVMKEHNSNAGAELLYLLRQQRYLYHQLNDLTKRQQQLAGANSPELLLEFISGRRKLFEKLRQVEIKLGPIKTNWQSFQSQIGPDYRDEVQKMANQIQEIIGEILTVSPDETTQNLPFDKDFEFIEHFAQTQPQS